MSGDFSRWSFQPWRDFSAVLMQQGRIHTDADGNEEDVIARRRLGAETIDALGRAVVPLETPAAFEIDLLAGGGMTIGPGRAYVDGLLAENHGGPPLEWYEQLAELRGTTPTAYTAQPYYPEPPALPNAGSHLAYLKVWQRELTHVEMPALIDPALGIDTTTRLQTAWQVKLAPVPAGTTCQTPLESIPGFVAAEPAAAGRLTNGFTTVAVEPDPCLVPPGGGYTGVENQFYRVEIHHGGGIGGGPTSATFKWSRDGASVGARVVEIAAALDEVVVDSVGRDEILGFQAGDWIEVTDDHRELKGIPGVLRRIKPGLGVDRSTNTIFLEAALPPNTFPVGANNPALAERNTRIRRWHQGGKVRDGNGNLVVDLDLAGATGEIAIPTGQKKVVLEKNIVVSFSLDGAGAFRTGDYWVFAARTVNATIEPLDHAPPAGVHAHYAPLAILDLPAGNTDCRTQFPPLGGLDAIEYVAGDGQEATPNPLNPQLIALPIDATVGVARGPLPVAGRTVRFTIEAGNGQLKSGANTGATLDVTSLSTGLAAVTWSLDPTTQPQRLRAVLLDANGNPSGLPVLFGARLRTADVVAYNPIDCPDLLTLGVNSVQGAIDALCNEPGVDHAACCTTIGIGAEFTTIDPETIETIAQRHDGHVCLCLLPERFRVDIEKIGGLQSLTIGGRGAVLELVRPLQLAEIVDVAIRDVELVVSEETEALPTLLDVIGCKGFTLGSVTASQARAEPGATVVRIDGSNVVRITESELRNAPLVRREMPHFVPDLPPMARAIIDLAGSGPTAKESLEAIAGLFANSAENERNAAAADITTVLAESASTIGALDNARLLKLGSFIAEAPDLAPGKLSTLMGTFGHLAGQPLSTGRGTGSVIEISDGEPDVWITDNRLAGGISLHGFVDPNFESVFEDPGSETSFFGGFAAIPKGKGTLIVEGNRFDWIRVGANLTNTPFFAFASLVGNRVEGRAHALVAMTMALSGNSFVREDERFLGLFVGLAATVVGNIGPQANPALRVVASARETTANVRLSIIP